MILHRLQRIAHCHNFSSMDVCIHSHGIHPLANLLSNFLMHLIKCKWPCDILKNLYWTVLEIWPSVLLHTKMKYCTALSHGKIMDKNSQTDLITIKTDLSQTIFVSIVILRTKQVWHQWIYCYYNALSAFFCIWNNSCIWMVHNCILRYWDVP